MSLEKCVMLDDNPGVLSYGEVNRLVQVPNYAFADVSDWSRNFNETLLRNNPRAARDTLAETLESWGVAPGCLAELDRSAQQVSSQPLIHAHVLMPTVGCSCEEMAKRAYYQTAVAGDDADRCAKLVTDRANYRAS